MKNKPVKNYLILLAILGITVILVFYARSWYIMSKEYYSHNSVITDVSSEINAEEISNYIIESPKFILYVSSGMNEEIKPFEKNFKKLIKQLDIQESIIYLNLDKVDIVSFNNELKSKYVITDSVASRVSNDSNSSIYVFENGKIISVLNSVSNYSNKQLRTMFKKWGITND